jgi:hypothetical protein
MDLLSVHAYQAFWRAQTLSEAVLKCVILVNPTLVAMGLSVIQTENHLASVQNLVLAILTAAVKVCDCINNGMK